MGDNWDDSDDDWDVDDDVLDAKLAAKTAQALPNFEEEDLAIKEKEAKEKAEQASLKKKGQALASKKQAEKEKEEELEIARKAMELEAEAEANMTPDELRAFKRKQIEEADNAITDDLFGGGRDGGAGRAVAVEGAGEKFVLKDAKDHLKHARKVAETMKAHGKIHLAASFFKEALQQSKDVLDDTAISDIIKTCNVIKNEKVQAAKRITKSKGQAQKSKKVDKLAEAKIKQKQVETFGDNDQYDAYDEYGADFEDSFF